MQGGEGGSGQQGLGVGVSELSVEAGISCCTEGRGGRKGIPGRGSSVCKSEGSMTGVGGVGEELALGSGLGWGVGRRKEDHSSGMQGEGRAC